MRVALRTACYGLSLLWLASCFRAEQGPTDVQRQQLQDKVKSVKTAIVDVQEVGGRMEEKGNVGTRENFFDDKGNEMAAQRYDINGDVLDRSEHVYDKSGRKLRTDFFDRQGNRLPDEISYEYDADGRMVGQRISRPGVAVRHRYIYDGQGRESVQEVISEYGVVKTERVYDEQGRVSELKRYLDGQPLGRRVSTYDEHDNELEGTEYDTQGNVTLQERFVYEYDTQGSWVKRIRYENGKARHLARRDITYY